MKFTKYFGAILNNYGAPHLDVATTKLIYNIIHLEGRLEQLDELKEKIKDSKNPKYYDYSIIKLKEQLSRETREQSPKEFFSSIIGAVEE